MSEENEYRYEVHIPSRIYKIRRKDDASIGSTSEDLIIQIEAKDSDEAAAKVQAVLQATMIALGPA